MKKKYLPFLKSIILVLALQAAGYYLLKLCIHDYHILTSIANYPLVKGFSIIYNTWYPFVFFSALIIFINDKDSYHELIYSLLIGSLLAQLTFIIYPSMIIRPTIEINSFIDHIVYYTYFFDTPSVNCLPSVHCLFSFIVSFYIFKSKNLKDIYKFIIICYFILIALSTVFVHQHIVEDLILAFIYMIITCIVTHIFKDKLKKTLKFLF